MPWSRDAAGKPPAVSADVPFGFGFSLGAAAVMMVAMSRSAPDAASPPASRWPHVLAWLTACAVFPLVWMGGLVTTYDAGMAVPDWPTTYGHWFYPLQKWLWHFGDLFLEHGHRTLAQGVGLLAIALVAAVWWRATNRAARWLSVALLGGVVFQGVLGGLRVLWDERLLAQVHACTAPLVFALAAAMVTLTSARWRRSPRADDATSRPTRETSGDSARNAAAGTACGAAPAIGPPRRLAILLAAGFYGEIVLGSLLRHPAWDLWARWFELWVWLKLIVAAALLCGAAWLARWALCAAGDGVADAATRVARRRAVLLSALLVAQLILAGATWVVNYGYPAWFRNHVLAVEYTVVREGALQVVVTTAHAAVGSLCLVAASSLALWAHRAAPPSVEPTSARAALAR